METMKQLNHTGAVLALLVIILATSVASAQSEGRQVYAESSPLAILLDALPDMPAEARLELAAVIVDSAIAAYEAELEQAMQQARSRGTGGGDLSHWYRGIGQVLEELGEWQAALYVAEEVEIHLDRHHQIMLMIDRRPLWVAWPRISARSGLERELVTEFCRRQACPDEVPERAAAQAELPSASSDGWRLSQLDPPTWHGADGVNCEFSDYTRLGEKERTCRELVADLHSLAAALRAAWRDGGSIEWQGLGLRGATAGGQHLVTINAGDDYIAVYVPALAAQRIDWQEAGRWLRAEVEGHSATATVLRAQP